MNGRARGREPVVGALRNSVSGPEERQLSNAPQLPNPACLFLQAARTKTGEEITADLGPPRVGVPALATEAEQGYDPTKAKRRLASEGHLNPPWGRGL